MAESKTTYDVFISFERRDYANAKKVADVLESFGLIVFFDQMDLPVGSNLEDLMWQAMSESFAFVVIIPDEVRSSYLAFELGAAKAWNKPIYAVFTSATHHDLPPMFAQKLSYPLSRCEEIAQTILESTQPLSEFEVQLLGEAYTSIGTPVDQLNLLPNKLPKLVDYFNERSGRQMAGEQVMSHLLRLRKKGSLPSLTKRKSKRR